MPVVDGRLDKCKRIPLERVTLIPPFLNSVFHHTHKKSKKQARVPPCTKASAMRTKTQPKLCAKNGETRAFFLADVTGFDR